MNVKKSAPSLNLGSLSPTRNQLVDILRESIIFGTLPPGTQIKQEEICKQFSCSPGPVREALRELESEGLLFHYPNRGVFVAEVSNHEIAEVLIPMRLLLEKFALCNTNLKFSSSAVASLNEQITAMRIGAETGNSKMAEEAECQIPFDNHASGWQRTYSSTLEQHPLAHSDEVRSHGTDWMTHHIKLPNIKSFLTPCYQMIPTKSRNCSKSILWLASLKR